MEHALPSYEMATSQDHWSIVAPYIESPDLCSASLVCERWHEIFAPELWGNPASHFGTEDDSVYVALTRFRRTLAWARLYVRQMTHTMHLPPAHAELYEGPHSDWLRDILDRLPNLQSLIVNGLPFFDHASLLTLRYYSNNRRPANPRAIPTFTLRFLDARACANATPSGLAEALIHFPSLIYLDLSKTAAASKPVVLSAIGSLRNLQILKLRNLSLRDEDIAMLAGKLGLRLRSLDVRDNNITDKSARTLLARCFQNPHDSGYEESSSFTESGSVSAISSYSVVRPPGSVYPYDDDALLHHQDEGLDKYIRNCLTTRLVDHLALEASYPSGITHLYISNNKFTTEGVSGLLRSGRLHVLDCGNVARVLADEGSITGATLFATKLPGVTKMLPIIAGLGSRQLTYLRINHEIVTEELPLPPQDPGELPEDSNTVVSSPDPPMLQPELDSGPLPVEMDDTGTIRFELPGDFVFLHVTPAQEQANNVYSSSFEEQSVTTNSLHSNSATQGSHEYNSYNSWMPGDDDENPSVVLSATGGLNSEAAAINGIGRPGNTSGPSLARPFQGHARSYSSIVAERRARAAYDKANPHILTPSMIAKLQTLVLTGVPSKTWTMEPIKRLTNFLTACGEEDHLAHMQAQLGYALPPGQHGAKSAQREYARSIFALERIILELAPPEAVRKRSTASWRRYPTKSSTEDADSEAFWDAAQSDFTFFGDEECGLPQQALAPGGALYSAVSDKIVVGPDEPMPGRRSFIYQQERIDAQAAPPTPKFDLVAELSKFRRERKSLYESALMMGEASPEIPGYWRGEIKVIRPFEA